MKRATARKPPAVPNVLDSGRCEAGAAIAAAAIAKPARRPAPPTDLVEEFDEIEQGSEAWLALKMGIPSASVFRAIMAEGRDGPDSKSRADLMHRLAAEVIFERPMETFSNADMERGLEQEPALLDQYDREGHARAFREKRTFPGLRRVGFIRRTIRDPLMTEPLVVGCSPDSLVGDDGIVQTKSRRPDLLVRLLDSARFPSEHYWQIHGELWVTGRAWCDLWIGYEDFPLRYVIRVERNEVQIAKLRNEVEKFAFEQRKLIERVRAKGNIR